jgi:hypothetical protein
LGLAIAATLACVPAGAVSLSPNGLGQALIYPYYTVRTAQGGNAFNTYISVVNTSLAAKAVRVRVREGRAARPVLDFNLYLSPNDAWAGAIVPTASGAAVITADTSCTDPAFAAGSGLPSLALHANGYTGANADGFGDTLDRTREGFVEIIEMAVLGGESAAAITHNAAGVPANCAAIRAAATVVTGVPTGGLSGTLTLINVNNGQDFTLDATALADLSTRPFFRPASDPYPDFAATEIDPVSAVVANGQLYRSTWTRPVDAVSAVLMRSAWGGEFILDDGTASLTDLVATLPTRHHYVTANASSAPFTATGGWAAGCQAGSGSGATFLGEPVSGTFFNREEQGGGTVGGGGCGFTGCPPPPKICAAAAVGWIHNNAIHMPPAIGTQTSVLGSTTGGFSQGTDRVGAIGIPPGTQNGWIAWSLPAANQLTSLPGSARTDLATGQATTGPHRYTGLPLVGFVARSFTNGTLQCDGASRCQGNYGGAFQLRFRRSITAP